MAHLAAYWHVTPQLRRLSAGRVDELPPWFTVLEFHRERTRCYATVGMSNGEPGGIETFIAVPDQNPQAVEFLHVLAHYDLTGARLDLGHTVKFGMELWDGSGLDHGFLSFPIRRPTGSMHSPGTTAADHCLANSNHLDRAGRSHARGRRHGRWAVRRRAPAIRLGTRLVRQV